jgi:hypothetical protein
MHVHCLNIYDSYMSIQQYIQYKWKMSFFHSQHNSGHPDVMVIVYLHMIVLLLVALIMCASVEGATPSRLLSTTCSTSNSYTSLVLLST